ncbi:hypothetical protein MMC12_001694 [Toensbergia leucococca]|nr:hypothetical protein [Toensbergia leucococca]
MCTSDIFLGLLAILFPPIAVWIKRGICSADSLINILLCCLGYIPGLIHAWYIVAKYPESDPDGYENLEYGNAGQGPARGDSVTYYYVNQEQSRAAGRGGREVRTERGPQRGYGTNEGAGAGAPAPAAQTQGQPQAGENAIPPSYEQAVGGDHKVQT